mgnify:FL=1
MDSQKEETMNAIKLAQEAISIKDQQKKIELIITNWKDTFDRIPNSQEIINELDDSTMNEFVKDYIEKYKKNDNMDNIIIETDETPV